MNAVDRFLFLAARQNLAPEEARHMCRLASARGFAWELAFDTAERQGVAPLLYRHVSSRPELLALAPKTLLDQYRLYTARVTFTKRERAMQFCKTLRFLHERNLDVVLLKGAAQDLLVNEVPWLTVSNDIDILLRPRGEALTSRAVQEINHQLYKKHIEYDFYEHHDLNMNGMLAVNFNDLWQNTRPASFYGEPVLVLSPEHHLLSLCVNCARKRFFRLKSLLDIYETIQKCSALNWDAFTQYVREYRCGNIVYSALAVVNRFIGGVVPAGLMAALGVSGPRAQVINLTLATLERFWSLSGGSQNRRPRAVDLSLLLQYATYNGAQIRGKILLARDRR